MVLKRILNLEKLLKLNSFFLFGPRGTGKSFWIKHSLPDVKVFDLLDADIFGRFLRRPRQLGEEIGKNDKIVVIDEIQKLPALLDEVHRLIESTDTKFLLTGSSARKLKHSGVNLLAGRAWEASFYPLCSGEIPHFDLVKYLNRGGLPRAWLSQSFAEELQNYTTLYLNEEIKAEALTRKIDSFARFLDILSLQNGKEMHYANISNDSGVPARTIENYLQILKDTLIGFNVFPFLSAQKRKAMTRSKFYFFDVGVSNALAKRGEIKPGSEAFGDSFEHWIITETRAYLGINRIREPLQYWRTKSGLEVDLIVGNKLAIEIKSTNQVLDRHLKGLKALREEGLIQNYIIITQDPIYREADGIKIYPWKQFLQDLWGHKLLALRHEA